MSRTVRQLLVVSLVALHATVTLSGQCLHVAPGSGHAATSTPEKGARHTHDSGQTPHDPSKNCPVCQLLSQGQLPVELTCVRSTPHVMPLDSREGPAARPHPPLRLSHSRAPPTPPAIAS